MGRAPERYAATEEDPEPLFDDVDVGRLLRAARIMAGYDRVADATAGLRTEVGVDISDRTLYAIERGEQAPTMSALLGLALLYRPPAGLAHFLPAVRPDQRNRLRELLAGGPQ